MDELARIADSPAQSLGPKDPESPSNPYRNLLVAQSAGPSTRIVPNFVFATPDLSRKFLGASSQAKPSQACVLTWKKKKASVFLRLLLIQRPKQQRDFTCTRTHVPVWSWSSWPHELMKLHVCECRATVHSISRSLMYTPSGHEMTSLIPKKQIWPVILIEL